MNLMCLNQQHHRDNYNLIYQVSFSFALHGLIIDIESAKIYDIKHLCNSHQDF